jgi:signal transduction histidine kinase/ligand-binding sensor domain-containing protein
MSGSEIVSITAAIPVQRCTRLLNQLAGLAAMAWASRVAIAETRQQRSIGDGLIRILCATSLLLSTSTWAVDPAWNLSEYAHRAWRLREGPLPARPFALTQTRDGFIWVGTSNGLIRYDGVRFLPWPRSGTNALPSNQIFSLLTARDGSLWIGTERSATHLQHGRLTTFLSTSEADVHHVFEDSQGAFWFWQSGARGKEPLCRVAADRLQCFGPEAGAEPQTIFSMLPDKEGYVWIGASTALLRWLPGHLESYPIPGLEHHTHVSGITAMARDVDGSMLIGIGASGRGLGVERFRDGEFTPVVVPGFDASTVEVSSLMVDRGGTIWIGTTDGIYRLRKNHGVDHYTAPDGLSGRTVLQMMEDRDGVIWTVTENGIDSFRDYRVVTLQNRPDLRSSEIDGVLATRDGSLWVGGWEALYTRKPGESNFVAPAGSLIGKQVSTLFEDSTSRLWIGVDDSLNWFDQGRFHTVLMPDGKPVGMIVSMTEDSQQQLWAVSLGPPRKVLHIDSARSVATEIVGLPPASKIARDAQEGVWLGLLSGQLAHYRGGQLRSLPIPHEGSESRIKQLVAVEDGSILASTDFGLAVLRGERIAVLSEHNGLPCSETFAAQFDLTENLWLYMQCGVVRIERAELERWWNAPQTKVRSHVLDMLDGAAGLLTPFDAAARTPDGRLWFANNLALQTLDPITAISTQKNAPTVYIDSLTADRLPLETRGEPSVPALTRDVQIDYTTPNFTSPDRVHFRYRLRPLDADWNDAGTRRQAIFTHPPPGHYKFELEAANADGVWGAGATRLQFNVLPAFYQTLWFRLSMGAVVLFMFAALVLLRTRITRERLRLRMEARNSERERIARDLHDTLLQGIQALSFRMKRWAVDSAIPEVQQREIERVACQTDSIIVAGREKILELRQFAARTSELAEALTAVGSACSSEGGPSLRLATSGNPRPLKGRAYEELSNIGAEAIRNAYKHSGASVITLDLEYRRRALRMAVVDNGRGMRVDTETVPPHYGLIGIRERAEVIDAELTIESAPDRGTTIRIIVPRESAYQ